VNQQMLMISRIIKVYGRAMKKKMLYLSVHAGKKFKQRFFDPGRLPKNAVHFFVPGDLDLQTRLSEGPNMSSM